MVRAAAELLNYASAQASKAGPIDVDALIYDLEATYFGWTETQRTAAAALHVVARRRRLVCYGIDYSTPDESSDPPLTRSRALEIISGVIKTKLPLHRVSILLWAAHTHLILQFSSTFYLAFQGKTGSGKGTAVESCILLAPNGVLLSDASDAYLASVLDEGRAIGIQEWDSLCEKNKGIEPMVRNGYRRGVTRGFMLPGPSGKGWIESSRSVFGPKVFDTHTGLTGHLLGRSIVIDMEPDDSVDRALDAEEKATVLAPLRKWLALEGDRALLKWTPARVSEHWASKGFRARVSAMGGKTGREHVIAALMLLTADVMGWELDVEVRAILSGRQTIEEFGVEAEVRDAIRSLAVHCAGEPELRTDDVLKSVNDGRAITGVTSRLSTKGLSRALRELGFRRDVDWLRVKSGPNRDLTVVRPSRLLTQWAERELPSQPAESCPPGPSSPLPQDEVGTLGTMGTTDEAQPEGSATASSDSEDTFAGALDRTELYRSRGSPC